MALSLAICRPTFNLLVLRCTASLPLNLTVEDTVMTLHYRLTGLSVRVAALCTVANVCNVINMFRQRQHNK